MSKGTKTLVRQCVSCKAKVDRGEMIRVLKNSKDSSYVIDPSSKVFGRSFYVCKKNTCCENLSKNKRYKSIELIGWSKEG